MKNMMSLSLAALFAVGTTVILTACDEDVVHQRPVSELNTAAENYRQQGNVPAAVCRLEAALDLRPNDTTTLNNLAIAYKENGQLFESMQTFESLSQEEGINQVAVKKALGIVSEAIADKYQVSAVEITDAPPAPKKLTPDEIKAIQKKALAQYEVAIAYYQEAIDAAQTSENGAAQVAGLEQQIELINEHRDSIMEELNK